VLVFGADTVLALLKTTPMTTMVARTAAVMGLPPPLLLLLMIEGVHCSSVRHGFSF
jgi:hypothetical protein